MSEQFHMDVNEVTKMFADGRIFCASTDVLVRALAGTSSTTPAISADAERFHEMAETIRHLIFLRQTEKVQNQSARATKLALVIAALSAIATVTQAIISLQK